METIPGLVSVMMPAYNAEAFIARAVESVLSQSYAHLELVVVDDGSRDRTAQIVASYADKRVKLVRQANGGEAVARNTALDHMSGEFVAFLDSDDEYLSEHLKLCVGYLQSDAERDAVYTDGQYVDPLNRRIQPLSSRRRGPFEGDIFEELVRASDVFGPPICVVMRRSLIDGSGCGFDPQIVIGPDWDFMTCVSQNARFGYIDAKTVLYRVHETNITVRTVNRDRVRYLARCREKAIHLDRFSSCSVETRSAVFYDLLVNLLPGQLERQIDAVTWPSFKALPDEEQGRLLRLMASAEIRRDGDTALARRWLSQSRSLNPGDSRGRILEALFRLSPQACAAVLRRREARNLKASTDEPFGGLA